MSGGGGTGAVINGVVDSNGSIVDVQIVEGGRGYYNLQKENNSSAIIFPNPGRAILEPERNASLLVSLGGSLKEPTLNNTQGNYFLFDGEMIQADVNIPFSEFRYVAPWVMILDKGRP